MARSAPPTPASAYETAVLDSVRKYFQSKNMSDSETESTIKTYKTSLQLQLIAAAPIASTRLLQKSETNSTTNQTNTTN